MTVKSFGVGEGIILLEVLLPISIFPYCEQGSIIQYFTYLVEAVGVDPTTPAPQIFTIPTAESRLHDTL
jgi:hypothetical protein